MNSGENFIGTSMQPVAKYLAESRKITVPEYQRSYAWTDEEVSQLWSDILDAINNHRAEYFIGPIVVKNNKNGEVDLIDGQQRITTTLIILSVLRSLFKNNNQIERADLLANWFFGQKDIVTLQTEEKFRMNEENSIIYREFISKDKELIEINRELKKYQKKNSNFLLLSSYLLLRSLIVEYVGNDFNKDKLLKLLDYLQKNVKILILSVNDEADAYQIFETLNDRGRSLDTLDLLKNHLFSKAKSSLPEVKQNWAILKENLLDSDPKNRFLSHLWSSLHGRGTNSGLFRAIRDEIASNQDAINFSYQLANASRVYEALHSGSSPIWDEYPEEVRKNINTLRLLDAQQALPVMLSAYEKFDTEEFRKLTRILVVMAVRYNFIGEERTGVAANYYSELSKPIRLGEMKKASHIFNHLKPIYPNDASFRDAFKVKSISDSKKARYILAEIENYASGSEKIVNSDPDEVNLEHVMPKKPNQNWGKDITNIDSEEYSYFVNRIGNLALVPKSMNKTSGAKSFNDKKLMLFSKCNEFRTTLSIANYVKWDKEKIEARQEFLADLAVKVWRYS